MLRSFLLLLLSLLASLALNGAVAEEATLSAQENVYDFNLIDADSNGQLSPEEFSKWYRTANHSALDASGIQALFNSYDLDANGAVSVREFVPLAYALSRKPVIEEETLFKRLDDDSNGELTQKELKESKENITDAIINGLFQVADSNHDGLITKEEYERVAKNFDGQSQGHGQEERKSFESLLVSIDGNQDSSISEQELTSFTNHFVSSKASASEIADAFQELDANADHQLSLEELQNLPDKLIQLLGIRPLPSVTTG